MIYLGKIIEGIVDERLAITGMVTERGEGSIIASMWHIVLFQSTNATPTKESFADNFQVKWAGTAPFF